MIITNTQVCILAMLLVNSLAAVDEQRLYGKHGLKLGFSGRRTQRVPRPELLRVPRRFEQRIEPNGGPIDYEHLSENVLNDNNVKDFRPVPIQRPPRLSFRRQVVRPEFASDEPVYAAPDNRIFDVPQPVSQIESSYDQTDDYSPIPYNFGYDTTDQYGNNVFRKETADGAGYVSGSYGYRDAYGIYRTVEYIADDRGYRATVKSNEPGLGPQAGADTEHVLEPSPDITQQSIGYDNVDVQRTDDVYATVDGVDGPRGQTYIRNGEQSRRRQTRIPRPRAFYPF